MTQLSSQCDAESYLKKRERERENIFFARSLLSSLSLFSITHHFLCALSFAFQQINYFMKLLKKKKQRKSLAQSSY